MLVLSDSDVRMCLPSVRVQVDIARTALIALARGDGEMPAKPAIHPRPGALVEAMPAWWKSGDVLGLKWIAAFPSNRRRGLAQSHGLLVLNDPGTGVPLCVADARELTLSRTSAISGAAMLAFARRDGTMALLGAGAQGAAHLRIARELGFAERALIYDRHVERAQALADSVNGTTGGASVVVAASARQAVEGSSLIVSCASLGRLRQALPAEWVAREATVISIDEDTYLSAAIANAAARFAVDGREQYENARREGAFKDFRAPDAMLGELLEAERSQSGGCVFVALGIGLADVMFAHAIYKTALATRVGTILDLD